LNISQGSIFKKLLIVIIFFILSLASYFFIEKPFRKIKFKKTFIFLFLNLILIILTCVYFLNLKFHPYLTKYSSDGINFELSYNYKNFSNKKNVFIVGNSYADNLLNIFSRNKELIDDYYFYTAVADNVGANYQTSCFVDFLKKEKIICDKNLFSFLYTQYENSNYIIFAERFNHAFYMSDNFVKMIERLKKDKKNFIVFLDDLSGADILDIFIHRKGRLPNLDELEELENKFFHKVMSLKKKDLKKVKDYFLMNNIKFLTRSELFCDYSIERCKLIKNNNKLYSDFGHITNNGAEHFSKKIYLLMNKLIDN